MREKSFVAVVVGNSTIRWCVIQDGVRAGVGAAPADDPLPDDIRKASAQLPLYVASVNPPRAERLGEETGSSPILIGRDVPVPIRNETRRPEQVGVDRLLAALGAWRTCGPAVVIDIGTAITVDLVAEGPAFHGGAILPGPQLWTRALRDHTALLPAVSVTAPPRFRGRDTEEAIACGVYWGIVGAISGLVDRVRGERSDAAVLLTGGGAPIFAVNLGAGVRYHPDLIFTGCIAAVAGACV